jgi:hypothetical protein
MTTRKYAALGIFLASASVLALATMTSSASADIVSVTYTGTVSGVTNEVGGVSTGTSDQLNLFGGGSLANSNFTLVFTFDTTLGSLQTTIANPAVGQGGFQTLLSGATFGQPDAFFIPATLQINGSTQSIAQGTGNNLNNAGSASTGAFGVSDSFGGTLGNYDAGISAGIGGNNGTQFSPGFLATPQPTSGTGSGSLVIDGGLETINFVPTLAVVADLTPAVPEPSTWAMMILGFLGIGAMTYRRRKGAALAA